MRVPRVLVNSFLFLREVVCEYIKDNGNLVAAAVGFYVFLSLIPLLLLAIAGLGFLLGSPDRAKEIVFSYIRDYSPTLAAGSGLRIRALVEEIVRGREAATGIGAVLILWSGTTLMVTLERAINVAFDIQRQRMFVINRLLALAMLVVAGALFAASFAVTTGLDALRNAHICLLGLTPAQWPWIWSFLGYLVPLVVTVTAFTLMYKILPCTFVPLRSALFGGIFAGVLWETAKLLFSLYVNNYAAYGKVYGSLAGVILLMVWINYSAIVTILGAEAGSAWAKRHSEKMGQ